MIFKTYTELSRLKTFEERFNYLMIGNGIGEETFGNERYLNQIFYSSPEWKKMRNYIILRDQGCDLGIEGRDLYDGIIIHHINPITLEDIYDRSRILLDPENLIVTCHRTHNALHYGSYDLLVVDNFERYKNDTCPWRK